VKRLGINARIERVEPKINGGRADARIVLQMEGKKVRYEAEVKRGRCALPGDSKITL
jgi:hypothetical protein